MKKIIDILLTSLKFSLVISLYGFTTSILIDVFTPPIGFFVSWRLMFTVLVYISYLIHYPAPITFAVICIGLSKHAFSVRNLRYLGFAIGVITNINYYRIMENSTVGFSIIEDYLIPFIIHTLLVGVFSMELFSKLTFNSK